MTETDRYEVRPRSDFVTPPHMPTTVWPGWGVSFMFVNGAPRCPQEMGVDWRAGKRDMKGALGVLGGTRLKMRSREIAELKDAIRVRHQCDALYVITIPIDAGGLSGWDGRVGVFELVGHPSAARAMRGLALLIEGRRSLRAWFCRRWIRRELPCIFGRPATVPQISESD